MITLPAGEFKAKCLKLLDNVAQTHEKLVVTKHGKPVACVVPYDNSEHDEINPLKGSVTFEKDLIASIDEEWEVNL